MLSVSTLSTPTQTITHGYSRTQGRTRGVGDITTFSLIFHQDIWSPSHITGTSLERRAKVVPMRHLGCEKDQLSFFCERDLAVNTDWTVGSSTKGNDYTDVHEGYWVPCLVFIEPLQVMVKCFEHFIVTSQDYFCEAGQEWKPTKRLSKNQSHARCWTSRLE